jgi:hypothetical protein
MTQISNYAEKSAELRDLLAKLNDANKDNALCVLRALVFAQEVAGADNKESA